MGKTFTVSDTVHIQAPVERCFLLSTNIELLRRTLGMSAVSGKSRGGLELGDRILWAGWKFGLPQVHEMVISRYERPNFFQDTMGRGRFKTFAHDHSFTDIDSHTLLHDKVRFSMPMGWAGRKVAAAIVVPHIATLLQRRFQLIKRIAESDEWEDYLGGAGVRVE